MKFVGLLSLIFVFCLLAVTLFSPSEAKLKKIKIAKKVAKLLLLKGVIRPKVALLALPLPVPIPIVRKTIRTPISNSGWDASPAHSTTSYEIPSLTSLPESILNLLRPALNAIATSAALRSNNQAWPVNSMSALDSWSPPVDSYSQQQVESYPAAPVAQNAWSSNAPSSQQQQEIVEQQQTNNYAA